MASATFFAGAHEFTMNNPEFSHVNGNQTRTVNHRTHNITGSHNTSTTDNRNSGNRTTKNKYEHRDNRKMHHQTYQDNRRADMGSRNPSSGYGGDHWTRKARQPDAYYAPQEEQDDYYAPQPARNQQKLLPAPPRSAPLLLENTPQRSRYPDSDTGSEEDEDSDHWDSDSNSYSPEAQALNDQIMASLKPKPNSRYAEPVPARHANGARSAPPFAESQHIPVQEAPRPARSGSAARAQAQSSWDEDEKPSRRNHNREGRDDLVQPKPLRTKQQQSYDRWRRDDEEDQEDDSSFLKPSHGRNESTTPYRPPSTNSRTESAHHTPARTPSPGPPPPPPVQASRPAIRVDGNESSTSSSSNHGRPGNDPKNSKPLGVPLEGRVESIGPGIKQSKSWRHRLFGWKKEESKDKSSKRRA